MFIGKKPKMKPKGKIVIIGGAEDKESEPSEMRDKNLESEPFEILKNLLHASKRNTLEIITSGSEIPHEIEDMYKKAFRSIGYDDLRFMDIKDEDDTHENHYLERIEKAGLVFFTGGIQERLINILKKTKIIHLIKKRYKEDEDFVIAGTSAGAMVMSEVMIVEGGVHEALIKGDLKTSKGLGILKNCIIDTHFIKRGRFARLAHAVAMNHDLLGIGLGEDTALSIIRGSCAECFGSGMVVIIDGRAMGHSNIETIREGEPIYIENLHVDLLVKGCRYSLLERKFFPSQSVKKEK